MLLLLLLCMLLLLGCQEVSTGQHSRSTGYTMTATDIDKLYQPVGPVAPA
jgi:hypothetical protein